MSDAFANAEPNYPRQSAPRRRLIDTILNPDSGDASKPDRCAPFRTQAGLGDDDILLSPPILYGFSLADKRWR
jgi:hypothetical protein